MSAINSLDSAVQSQGIQITTRDWLDMGSPTWATTPDIVKAAAFQAAKVTGFTDNGLIRIMLDNWGQRVDEDQAKFTLETLTLLAEQHPFEVEQVREDDSKPPMLKFQGCDKVVPFPDSAKQGD